MKDQNLLREAFGDLDPKIDARLADMKEEKEDQWTGYHKIEKSLYQDNKIDETTKKMLINY